MTQQLKCHLGHPHPFSQGLVWSSVSNSASCNVHPGKQQIGKWNAFSAKGHLYIYNITCATYEVINATVRWPHLAKHSTHPNMMAGTASSWWACAVSLHGWCCYSQLLFQVCFSLQPIQFFKGLLPAASFFFFILNTDTYFSKCLLQVGESHWLYKLTCENSNRGRLLCLAFGLWVLHLNDFVL